MEKTNTPRKVRKVLTRIANVLSFLIIGVALILVINLFVSTNRGYTSFFGYAYYNVQSNSMDADNKDSFTRGDIIRVKLLKDSEKDDLKVGTVITFWDVIGGEKRLNTHRIVEVVTTGTGEVLYRTKGDANDFSDTTLRTTTDVQGVYKGKSKGTGKAILWMQGKTGFVVCVIVPCVLIVCYCIYLVIRAGIDYSKAKMVVAKDAQKEELYDEMREKIRAELMQEMKESEDKKEE